MYFITPINQNRILAELNVQPYSTFINYKLEQEHVDILNNYVKEYSNDLKIVPIQLSKYNYPHYYLSVNIYNCTSPIMMSDDNIIRCELNTYVKTSDNQLGTLILDYASNSLSMDPINIFKKESKNMKFLNHQ